MTLTNDDLQAMGSVVDQKLKSIKIDIRHIKKIVDTTAKLLDLEQMRQKKQIKRIEEHLNLPSYS